jgi:gamma-glutamyl phosphate reductase
MQLGEQLLLAEQKLQEAQSARTALLSFCQQEKDRIAAQAADSLQSVKAELAKAEAERLSKEREIESRALMSADLRLQASEEEIRRLSRALLQSRADCAKAEKQSGDLRRELSKAADALAELKVCNERHPAAPSDLSFS